MTLNIFELSAEIVALAQATEKEDDETAEDLASKAKADAINAWMGY